MSTTVNDYPSLLSLEHNLKVMILLVKRKTLTSLEIYYRMVSKETAKKNTAFRLTGVV